MQIIKRILLCAMCFVTMTVMGKEGNYLSEDFYGFEDGGEALWLQNSEWSIASDIAANNSKHSLCYSSGEAISGQKKAHGGSNNSGITLKAGTYTFKQKVWVADDCEVTSYNLTLKDPWTNFTIKLDEMERNTWVDVSFEHTFDTDVENSGCLFTVAASAGGKGTFYIDDVQIWGEMAEPPVYAPFISEISTINDGNLYLPSGEYTMSLMMFVEENTNISTCYTEINEPLLSQEWDLGSVTKGEWVQLTKDVVFPENVDGSSLKLFVNNDPDFGGGKGTFYLDDITFTIKDITDVKDKRKSKIRFYPNPVHDVMTIETESSGSYRIYDIRGNLIKAATDIDHNTQVKVSNMVPGIYLLQVKTDKGSNVEQFIVK